MESIASFTLVYGGKEKSVINHHLFGWWPLGITPIQLIWVPGMAERGKRAGYSARYDLFGQILLHHIRVLLGGWGIATCQYQGMIWVETNSEAPPPPQIPLRINTANSWSRCLLIISSHAPQLRLKGESTCVSSAGSCWSEALLFCRFSSKDARAYANGKRGPRNQPNNHRSSPTSWVGHKQPAFHPPLIDVMGGLPQRSLYLSIYLFIYCY